MMIKFVCTYEGWIGSYAAKCAPRIGEDVTFPGKTGQYQVTAVKHEVVKANNARSKEPDIRVYVRPRKIAPATPLHSVVVDRAGGVHSIHTSTGKVQFAKEVKKAKLLKEAENV